MFSWRDQFIYGWFKCKKNDQFNTPNKLVSEFDTLSLLRTWGWHFLSSPTEPSLNLSCLKRAERTNKKQHETVGFNNSVWLGYDNVRVLMGLSDHADCSVSLAFEQPKCAIDNKRPNGCMKIEVFFLSIFPQNQTQIFVFFFFRASSIQVNTWEFD